MTVTETRWLKGLCSTQAKVEGTLLTAAWLWGRDSSVTCDTLGELGRTTLYVFLLSAWVSVEPDCVLSPDFRKESLTGDSDSYK